jgi:hypothetical protein
VVHFHYFTISHFYPILFYINFQKYIVLTRVIHFYYYGVMVTHLTTTLFLYQKHRPEDGRVTGRNMLVRKLLIKVHHRISKCIIWLFVHFTKFDAPVELGDANFWP